MPLFLHSTNLPEPLGRSLGLLVCGAIADAQILAVGERRSRPQRLQVDFTAGCEHLDLGPAVADDCMEAEIQIPLPKDFNPVDL